MIFLSKFFVESGWHMIFGGNGLPEFLTSVEIYNSKTGQQRQLRSDLPEPASGHFGTVMNGYPVYCGGDGGQDSPSRKCYRFDKEVCEWEQVRH